jgi:hypothetical protein
MGSRPGRSSWDGDAARAQAGIQWLSLHPRLRPPEIVYHRGDLALDNPPRPNDLVAVRTLAMCAARMRYASERGEVELLQRRHGEHDYEYIARAR